MNRFFSTIKLLKTSFGGKNEDDGDADGCKYNEALFMVEVLNKRFCTGNLTRDDELMLMC